MATTIACCGTVSTASSAADCTARLRPVVTAAASSGCCSCSVSTSAPAALSETTRHPARPATWSSTARRTAGSTWEANARSGASRRVSVVNRTPGSS
nr:hypothetical protein GCM10020241_50860 [Streptoalloteichus tenebrarius]